MTLVLGRGKVSFESSNGRPPRRNPPRKGKGALSPPPEDEKTADKDDSDKEASNNDGDSPDQPTGIDSNDDTNNKRQESGNNLSEGDPEDPPPPLSTDGVEVNKVPARRFYRLLISLLCFLIGVFAGILVRLIPANGDRCQHFIQKRMHWKLNLLLALLRSLTQHLALEDVSRIVSQLTMSWERNDSRIQGHAIKYVHYPVQWLSKMVNNIRPWAHLLRLGFEQEISLAAAAPWTFLDLVTEADTTLGRYLRIVAGFVVLARVILEVSWAQIRHIDTSQAVLPVPVIVISDCDLTNDLKDSIEVEVLLQDDDSDLSVESCILELADIVGDVSDEVLTADLSSSEDTFDIGVLLEAGDSDIDQSFDGNKTSFDATVLLLSEECEVPNSSGVNNVINPSIQSESEAGTINAADETESKTFEVDSGHKDAKKHTGLPDDDSILDGLASLFEVHSIELVIRDKGCEPDDAEVAIPVVSFPLQESTGVCVQAFTAYNDFARTFGFEYEEAVQTIPPLPFHLARLLVHNAQVPESPEKAFILPPAPPPSPVTPAGPRWRRTSNGRLTSTDQCLPRTPPRTPPPIILPSPTSSEGSPHPDEQPVDIAKRRRSRKFTKQLEKRQRHEAKHLVVPRMIVDDVSMDSSVGEIDEGEPLDSSFDLNASILGVGSSREQKSEPSSMPAKKWKPLTPGAKVLKRRREAVVLIAHGEDSG
ncbi:hypothetical protein H0H87_003482 [Tephrocybe sp. NHM501043]|nr:hypothetical protein H0H87_003482 [Tephrocybe sp. NHM501043]